LALAWGQPPADPGSPVVFIGEAKHRDRRPGMAELRRLQHLRDPPPATGHDATDAAFGLFSATGFTAELQPKPSPAKARFSLPP
jgi:uncharacterized protein